MALLPRTLLGQTALLFTVLMLLAQGLTTSIFRDFAKQQRPHLTAALISSNIISIREALESMPPAARASYLKRLNERAGVQLRPPLAVEGASLQPSERSSLARAIATALAQPVTVLVEGSPKRNLWISFEAVNQSWWLVVPIQRIERSEPLLRWIASLGLIGVAALLGAILIAWRVNRPIKELSQVAQQVGQGKLATRFPESGPAEVQALGSTFNAMLAGLRRLNAEREFLLAGVSHDLRTPLSRLHLMLEMSSLNDQEKAGMVSELEEMNGIIGQFIDFVQAEQAEVAQPSQLNDLVLSVTGRFQQAGHPISTHLADLPLLPLRPIAVRRLLDNLLDNAIKHGGGKVTVVTVLQDEYVLLNIRDQGPGIPAAERAYLQQPFTRREGQTAGAGLGLAIANRIAALHHGSLTLVDHPGGGLEVHVCFPRQSTTAPLG